MRIIDLEVLVLDIIPGRPFCIGKLSTDEGLVGLGEARASHGTGPLLAYLEEIRPRLVLGADPFETEKLVGAIVADAGRIDAIVAAAIALIEVACWDLIGRALGVPVYRLLGGAVRDRIPAYASGWDASEKGPEALAAAARRAVARGYRALRLDPFGAGRAEPTRAELHEALSRCQAVRAAVGPDVELAIALLGRFTPAAAIRIARALERIEPAWLEEPVPPEDFLGLEHIASRIRLPVGTGARLHHRSEFRALFEQRACALIQPDLTLCCGLGELKKLAAMAEVYSLPIALHNASGPVATAANLHLAASLPNFKIQEHDVPGAVQEAVTGCPEVVAGSFPLPQGPGLGVSLNEDILRAHSRQRP